MLAPLMQELSKDLGIDPPIQPEQGNCEVLFSPETVVAFTELGSGFSLFCQIGPCPKENAEDFLTQALLGNLFAQGTAGAVLALNDETNVITLSIDIPHSVEYKEFRDILEDFLNTVEFWQDEIKSPSHQT